MHANYIQLPPNSTGPKMNTIPTWVIGVPDASIFKIGDEIVGVTSGAQMVVVQSSPTHIYTKFPTKMQEGTLFVFGENISRNSIVISNVNDTPYKLHINPTVNVSYDNPSYGQRIDAQGQAYVRFEEGAQILDAVGRTKVVQDNISGAYKFTTLECWDDYMQTTIVGTASKTMDANHFGIKLQTGTAQNDSIALTSHKYHIHVPGSGLYTDLLVNFGDSGKTNLSREWGYADTANGIFFDLMGTELNIVVRNSITGTPIDTHYIQSEWNRDNLDGTGISGLTLDITKVNRYWFDIHRGVRFRAGIYGPKGERIVAHDIYIANTSSQLKLPNTSLPIRVWQGNVGGVSISTSEMTFYEGIVKVEGDLGMHKHFYEAAGVNKTITSAAWVPLISLRPQTDAKHTIAMLLDAAISAVLSSDANIDGRVKVEVFKNADLTGATFAVTKGDSRYNIDTASTAVTGGKAVVELFVKGTLNSSIENHFTYLDEFLCQKIDGTNNTYTLAAKAIAADCVVMGAINWNEYFVR